MATSTQSANGVQMIDVAQITISDNVRELDAEHVENLAGSIQLRGLRVSVIVRPDGAGFELIAGFHRFAAHQKLGLVQIRAEIQDDAHAHVDRGLENIARKQLNPYEEAQAVAAMLADGLSEDGAAQALGWPRRIVDDAEVKRRVARRKPYAEWYEQSVVNIDDLPEQDAGDRPGAAA